MPLLDQTLSHTSPGEFESGNQAASDNATLEEAGSPFVAISPVMATLRQRVELLASINTPVLIMGENGSGKHTVARLIHQLSSRAQSKFVKACSGASSTVLERELFGSKPGARNDRLRSWPGKIELAQRGSLFISDIAELPLAIQAELLRTLRQGQLLDTGAAPTFLDVRLLAGTTCDLEEALDDGRIRQDLYYYINAFVVQVPPLRDRREDISELLKQFVQRIARQYGVLQRDFSSAFLQVCQDYSWPGNLLELENVVKRYLIGDDEVTLQQDLRQRAKDLRLMQPGVSTRESANSGLRSIVRTVRETTEKDLIASALTETHWNRKAAARLLKISYRALLYKIADFHLVPPVERPHAER